MIANYVVKTLPLNVF